MCFEFEILHKHETFEIEPEIFHSGLEMGLSYLEPPVAPFKKLFVATGSIKKVIWSHPLFLFSGSI